MSDRAGEALVEWGSEINRMPTRIFIVPTATDLEAVESITARLEDVVGVLKIDVMTQEGEVRVRYQKPAAETALIRGIEAAGYPVTQ